MIISVGEGLLIELSGWAFDRKVSPILISGYSYQKPAPVIIAPDSINNGRYKLVRYTARYEQHAGKQENVHSAASLR